MAFRIAAEKFHLTYKTHINIETLIEKFRSLGDIVCYSIVHENGDTEEECPTPYKHTHAAVKYKKRLDSIDPRVFDVENVHPNISTKKSLKWFANLLEQYHKGHKTKPGGKKYFIEPVKLEQYGTERILGEEVMFQAIVDATTLNDACIIAGVVPKSVGDVNTLRKEVGQKRKRVQVPDQVNVDKFNEVDYDMKKALVLKGPPNCGKTSWAISRFKNPLKVCDIDDLRQIDKDVDGLVFDEMLFGNYNKATQVFLLDMDYDNTIRTRHTNATIPKGMPRIFLCNDDECSFGYAPHEAVKRRYNEIVINENMYTI